MRYFTSDTHFGHKNIIKYANRPFNDFFHMDEAIVSNWNALIGPTDVVFHLGDVALGDSSRWKDILPRLDGYKILVVGNHDRIFAGEKQRQRDKWDEHYHTWFDEVYDNFVGLQLADGTKVNLSHFPYTGDSHDGDRYEDFRLDDDGTVLIHGHTHAEFDKLGKDARVSRSKSGTLQIHVGQDAWGYRPVAEAEVLNLIKDNA